MTTDQLLAIYHQVLNWAIPLVLGVAINYLRQISVKMGELSETLATALTRLDFHEKRLDRLEDTVSSVPCRRD